MAVTLNELRQFHDFAAARLADGQAESVEQLLELWRVECSKTEDLTAIRRGVQDADAGRVLPLDQAFDSVRQELRARS